MKYSIDKKDRMCVLKIEEANLNSVIAPDLKSEFVLLKNQGVPNMILDLTDVDYIDSSGLSAILTANRLWKSSGSFVISGTLSDSVKKLIEISRLNSILTIIPTISESEDYILMEEVERELNSELDESKD